MGGRSSSSSSQSSAATNIDRRVAATDSANVATEGSVLYDYNYNYEYELDNGAIDSAFSFASEAGAGAFDLVREWGAGFLNATTKATDAATATANRAFDFVEEARKEADERNFQKALPWLVLGVAVWAITR